jgi:hypothetical protein
MRKPPSSVTRRELLGSIHPAARRLEALKKLDDVGVAGPSLAVFSVRSTAVHMLHRENGCWLDSM